MSKDDARRRTLERFALGMGFPLPARGNVAARPEPLPEPFHGQFPEPFPEPFPKKSTEPFPEQLPKRPRKSRAKSPPKPTPKTLPHRPIVKALRESDRPLNVTELAAAMGCSMAESSRRVKAAKILVKTKVSGRCKFVTLKPMTMTQHIAYSESLMTFGRSGD